MVMQDSQKVKRITIGETIGFMVKKSKENYLPQFFNLSTPLPLGHASDTIITCHSIYSSTILSWSLNPLTSYAVSSDQVVAKDYLSSYKYLIGQKIISGPEIIDSQWKPTLSIINIGSMVLRISLELGQTSVEYKIIPIFITLASCCWMYQWCKWYFDTYVAPALD